MNEPRTPRRIPGEEPVDTIAERAIAAGSPRVEGPVERPWNVREITVHDLDGYRIRFSEPIDTTKNFKEVMGQAESEEQISTDELERAPRVRVELQPKHV